MVKVSVIVPVYNAQEYLEECLESLVHQTLEEIEIVCVNDGSNDASPDILTKYQEKYPQKVIVISKENGGQASARNLGIRRCSGEYIGFVDADDYVAEEMFEKMYHRAKLEDSDYIECRYRYLQVTETGETKKLLCYGNVRPFYRTEEMFFDPLVSPWNKLYRAKILKDNSILFPEGFVYEDTSFYVKAIPFIKKASFEPEEYVYHFLRAGSTMNAKKDKRVGNIFPVIEDVINFYKKNQLWDLYHNELEYFCTKILLCSSLARIADVKDTDLKRTYMKKTIGMMQMYFPGYRQNTYIKKSKKGLYMRCISPYTIKLVVWLLRFHR